MVYLADEEEKCAGIGLVVLNADEEQVLLTIADGKTTEIGLTEDLKVYGLSCVDYSILSDK